MKYKREITPDINSETDRILEMIRITDRILYIRNDLFEQVIKSCKATNKEFLMIKEKLGICLYEENYYTEEIIRIQDNTEVPSIKEISKISNIKSTKKLTKDTDNKSNEVIDKVLINELDNRWINEPHNKSINKPDNKSLNESDNKSITKTVNSNTTSWYDKNKFNKILTTIDNNNVNHKNKTDKLKFNDINDLIDNIKSNTIMRMRMIV